MSTPPLPLRLCLRRPRVLIQHLAPRAEAAARPAAQRGVGDHARGGQRCAHGKGQKQRGEGGKGEKGEKGDTGGSGREWLEIEFFTGWACEASERI